MAVRIIEDPLGRDTDYGYVSFLGRGQYGIVSKVRRIRDGKIFACKEIDCSRDESLATQVPQELATWAAVGKEKYITEYSDCSFARADLTVRVYMPCYAGGDLQGVIDAFRGQGSHAHPLIAVVCASQIAKGIKTCHQKGIIHRDLKPANVLLSAPLDCNELLWKVTNGDGVSTAERKAVQSFVEAHLIDSAWCHVSDFGFSKFSAHLLTNGHQTITSYFRIGTPPFIAPETIGVSGRFSSKSDVYSLGCLLYYLCEGRLPFPNPDNRTTYRPVSSRYPEVLRRIIDRSVSDQPNLRPNIGEIVTDTEALLKQQLRDVLTPIGGARALDLASASRSSEQTIRQPTPRVLSGEEQEDLNKQLRQACHEGKTEEVEGLLARGANPAATDNERLNAMHMASMTTSLPVVKALLRHGGVDINRTGKWNRTPLHWAAARSNDEVVIQLLVWGAKVDAVADDCETALHLAVVHNKQPVVAALMTGNPDLNMQDKWGKTPLHWAMDQSNEDFLVKTATLLSKGADTGIHDRNNYAPLHLAAAKDNTAAIDLLLNHGADIEDKGGKHGTTPLHKACWEKSDAAVRKLLARGADVRARSGYDDNLPIHIAARKGHTAIGRALLEHVGDGAGDDLVHARDCDGWTPLHIAARWNSVSFARMLLERGASPTVTNNAGNKPRQLTVPIVHFAMRDLLGEAER